MKLQFLNSTFSVCRLGPDAAVPSWASGEFLAVVRTADELTVIAPSPVVPAGVTAEHDYGCFRVVGTIEFDVIGVISSISRVFAESTIPILTISTFDTDYFFVRRRDCDLARRLLMTAGYEFA